MRSSIHKLILLNTRVETVTGIPVEKSIRGKTRNILAAWVEKHVSFQSVIISGTGLDGEKVQTEVKLRTIHGWLPKLIDWLLLTKYPTITKRQFSSIGLDEE